MTLILQGNLQISYIKSSGISDAAIEVLKKEEISGEEFLDLSQEDLRGINLTLGQKKLLKLQAQYRPQVLAGEQRGAVAHYTYYTVEAVEQTTILMTDQGALIFQGCHNMFIFMTSGPQPNVQFIQVSRVSSVLNSRSHYTVLKLFQLSYIY